MTADNFEIAGGHRLRLRAVALALRGPPLQCGPSVLLSAAFNTGIQCMDPVNDSSAGDIKIAVISSAEAAVLWRHIVRSFDVAKVLAFGAEYLNAGRRRCKSVARAVNA